MRQAATATDHAARLLRGPGRPARVLGAFPTACYLELPDGAVLALLAPDAVQLPIGLTLPGRTDLPGRADVSELPGRADRSELAGPVDLSELAGPAEVGGGMLTLDGLTVTIGARRSAALRRAGCPVLPPHRSELFDDPVTAVAGRLGAGPGLTPAGDDELCGALAANVLFGLDDSRLATAVADRLARHPRATTSLSQALLERATAGDGVPQLQRLAEAWCHRPADVPAAWAALQRIGHTSGTALATGLLAGARHAAATRKAA